jgi:two-component system nitrogen regulation response regulator NtrX
VARALHPGSSRSGRPFIKVNCAAIPAELLESELFGHERGAFTGAVSARRGKFELAQGGTLLLDEIGDMNPSTQAKLLRVLEENEMERLGGEKTLPLDVRVLASTNQDLEARMESGEFRRDLYHRLKVVPIDVPPLRRRSEDIPELADHFLARFCAENGRARKTLSEAATGLLCEFDWPGNVRELKNLSERLVIMVDGERVDAASLGPLLAVSGEARARDLTLAESLVAHERRLLEEALIEAGGNVAAAARSLGLDRGNLHRKLQRLGIKD